jgi:hypothetical protein
MTLIGNRILVYYDEILMIDATDNNFDSRAPYLSGGISVDWWTGSLPYTITVDAISVDSLPTYDSSGVLTSSAFDGGDNVQWQTISWDAETGSGTNVCIRTRTADLADQLAGATWSGCYGNSIGSAVMDPDRRWIQYQAELNTSDPSATPYIDEIRLSYLSGMPGGSGPVISSLLPVSVTAGGTAFTLTVNGSGFSPDSVVRWNGLDRTTTYISQRRTSSHLVQRA